MIGTIALLKDSAKAAHLISNCYRWKRPVRPATVNNLHYLDDFLLIKQEIFYIISKLTRMIFCKRGYPLKRVISLSGKARSSVIRNHEFKIHESRIENSPRLRRISDPFFFNAGVFEMKTFDYLSAKRDLKSAAIKHHFYGGYSEPALLFSWHVRMERIFHWKLHSGLSSRHQIPPGI